MERKSRSWIVETLGLCFLCHLTVNGVSGDGVVCNGRGRKGPNDKCICDSEWPAQGQYGWAGPDCNMRVYGASFSEGTDLTEQCKEQNCSFLMPDDWLCYALPIEFYSKVTPWNHLTIQLERVSESDAGDPDLYGLFYNATADSKHVDNTTYSFDFRETSSSSHRTVVKKVLRKNFIPEGSDYKGVYLCVKAYGEANVTYALRATVTRCPSDFTEAGQQLVCSSPVGGLPSEKRYSECTDEGECICKPPYARPVEHPYDFLGFEDCSAKVTEVTDQDLNANRTFVREHEKLGVKGWSFYGFNVSEDDYQVVVNLSGEKDDTCTSAGYFGLFVKYGQPPGWRYGEWDYRPEWDYFGDKDKTVEIRFDRTSEGFHTGTWYAGVNGDDVKTCQYTITISKYECPMNCSSRGSCLHHDNGTRTCVCDKRFFGPDCSIEAHPLEFGKSLQMPESNFEYEYFMLPDITPDMLAKHNTEVRLEVTYSSSAYTEWAAARPELLLLKGGQEAMPSSHNYTFKQLLEAQNTTYEINLCPSQLKQGKWAVAMYNPIRVYAMGYNLTAVKQVHCLNNCSGHGECQEDGTCVCQSPWNGGDCSLDQSVSCVQGNRHGTLKPSARGTCWQECQCPPGSTQCRFGGPCVDFTCDDASWRRKGDADECVLDQCSSGTWSKTDDHVCLRQCKCPLDGSACHLEEDCSPDHFECLPGYRRRSSRDLTCEPIPCSPGDLQVTRLEAGNGRAFQFCNCTGQPCALSPASLDSAVLVCDSGFIAQGAQQWNSSGVVLHVGGRCVRPRRGTPGWGVFLWVFFSLPVGAALGLALQWYLVHRMRRGGPLAEGLYHELSMDTGF